MLVKCRYEKFRAIGAVGVGEQREPPDPALHRFEHVPARAVGPDRPHRGAALRAAAFVCARFAIARHAAVNIATAEPHREEGPTSLACRFTGPPCPPCPALRLRLRRVCGSRCLAIQHYRHQIACSIIDRLRSPSSFLHALHIGL